MTPEDIKQCRDDIDKTARAESDRIINGCEQTLYREVLDAIKNGDCDDPQALAAAAIDESPYSSSAVTDETVVQFIEALWIAAGHKIDESAPNQIMISQGIVFEALESLRTKRE